MSFTTRAMIDALRTLAFGSIGATYTAIGMPFEYQARIICFTNTTNEDVLFGTPGLQTAGITNITQAANGVVTSPNHGLATGTIVRITGVVGMTQVNGLPYTITVVDANTFELNVDTTSYGAYLSGGVWSFSGVFDQLIVPAGSFKLFDITTNHRPVNQDDFILANGTQWYVRYTAVPASGAVYIEVVYAQPT